MKCSNCPLACAGDALCEQGSEISLCKGEEAHVASKAIGGSLCIIKSGVVAVIKAADDGSMRGLFIVQQGQIANVTRVVGDTDLYAAEANEADFAYALCDARICLIPLGVAKEYVRANGDFAFAILRQMADRYRDSVEYLTVMAGAQGVERIRLLLDMIRATGLDPMQLTHGQIGRLLGMNRVTVTRLLGKAYEDEL